MKKLFVLFLVVSMLVSCKKESPTEIVQEDLPGTNEKGFYIVNEGNFQKSNSSISFYSTDNNKLYLDVYYTANKDTLGDVANDMFIYGNRGFIVVNNSHKIKVISLETHKVIGTVLLPTKNPNKVIIVDSTRGYVTDQNGNTVTKFNPITFSVIKDITVGMNPSGITALNGKLYVCNSGYGSDSTISIIDLPTDQVIKTLTVEKGPSDIGIDSDGDIIVTCFGYENYPADITKDKSGNITVINPLTNSIKTTIPLPVEKFGHPIRLAISQKGFGLTIVKNGILKFDTKADTIVSESFIASAAYGVGIDDRTNRILIGDANYFSSAGNLNFYSMDGNKLGFANVGIGPKAFVFR